MKNIAIMKNHVYADIKDLVRVRYKERGFSPISRTALGGEILYS